VSWSKPQPAAAGPISHPDELPHKIQALTDALTLAQPGAFSTDAIVIEMSSPEAPDLTLIDLPGIVRTATAGQDNSIITQVNNMIERVISPEHTIVLAVLPAPQDVATVDVLERAARVDPHGQRTLAVLTKPDLVPPGGEGEVLQVLTNQRKPLKLGYVMVRNLVPPVDDEGGESKGGGTPIVEALRQARQEERDFFRTHPHFSRAPRTLLGVPALTQRLTDLLVTRIQATLPGLKFDLEHMLEDTQKQLRPLGTAGAPTTPAEKTHVLVQLVSEYCQLVRHSMRGDYRHAALAGSPDARMHALFQRCYRGLAQGIQSTRPGGPEEPNFARDIDVEMTTQRGRELPGFLNQQVFLGYIISNVERWRPFADECRARVCEGALSASAAIINALAPQYPGFATALRDITAELIEQQGEALTHKLDDMFAKEQDPFTANEALVEVVNGIRFRTFDTALQGTLDEAEQPRQGEPVEALKAHVLSRLGQWYMGAHGVNQKGNVEEMKTLLQAYWGLATRRLVDNLCMAVEHDFAAQLAGKLETECFTFAGTVEGARLDAMLEEDATVQEMRSQLQAKEQRLQAALQVLRDMAPDCVSIQRGVAPAENLSSGTFFAPPS